MDWNVTDKEESGRHDATLQSGMDGTLTFSGDSPLAAAEAAAAAAAAAADRSYDDK